MSNKYNFPDKNLLIKYIYKNKSLDEKQKQELETQMENNHHLRMSTEGLRQLRDDLEAQNIVTDMASFEKWLMAAEERFVQKNTSNATTKRTAIIKKMLRTPNFLVAAAIIIILIGVAISFTFFPNDSSDVLTNEQLIAEYYSNAENHIVWQAVRKASDSNTDSLLRVYFDQQQYDKGIKLLNSSIDSDSSTKPIYIYNIGFFYAENDDLTNALRAFDWATRNFDYIGPYAYKAYIQKAITYLKFNQREKAVSLLNEIKINTSIDRGTREEAAELLQKLEIEPQ